MNVTTTPGKIPGGLTNAFGDAGQVEFTFIPEHLNATRARIDVTVTIPAENAITLNAGINYFGFMCQFAPPHDCSGCQVDACFVINDYVTIAHDTGEATLYGDNYNNYAQWNYPFNCPFVISVDPMTWGRTKAMFRELR